MQTQTLIFIFVLLTIGFVGPSLAEERTCIHRTADGRCLHWVPATTNPGQAPDNRRDYYQSAQPSQGSQPLPSAPSSGCVYDSLNRTYRQCFHIDASGRCQHFGGRCN